MVLYVDGHVKLVQYGEYAALSPEYWTGMSAIDGTQP